MTTKTNGLIFCSACGMYRPESRSECLCCKLRIETDALWCKVRELQAREKKDQGGAVIDWNNQPP